MRRTFILIMLKFRATFKFKRDKRINLNFVEFLKK